MGAAIKHITDYYPACSYTNDDYFNEFPELNESREKLSKVGVENRYIVDKSETASDLSYHAAQKLFEIYEIDKNKIEFLIFCSTEFDHYTPTTAAILQNRLELPTNIGAIDIVSSCTGYIQSLSIAKSLVESEGLNNVLILAVSTLTKTFHPKDANSKFLFGDAATATLITAENEGGLGKFIFGTDGSRSDYIIVEDGGARNPISENSFDETKNEYGNITCKANFYMNGAGIFIFGLKTIPKLVDDILLKNNMSFEEIDYFVFHQANEFLLKSIQKKLNIPNEKFIIEMSNTGNTVAATIPIALKKLISSSKVKKGDTILFAAFGTGLTWGGTILKI